MHSIIKTIHAATENATSTSHNMAVAWPYIAFSIVIILGLIGTAHRILRNQTD